CKHVVDDGSKMRKPNFKVSAREFFQTVEVLMDLQYIVSIAPFVEQCLLPKIDNVHQMRFQVDFRNRCKNVSHFGIVKQFFVKCPEQHLQIRSVFDVSHKKMPQLGH